LHQEDFCQALGIVSEMKYQKEGGSSLKQSFALLREVSSTPVIDLSRLLDAVIFNYLVGNNDAHGKNFSLLYRGIATNDMQVSLSPLYDIVSTVYYPEISRTMAMKLGGEYSSEKVMPRNFEQFAEEAGLAKPMVRRRVILAVVRQQMSAVTIQQRWTAIVVEELGVPVSEVVPTANYVDDLGADSLDLVELWVAQEKEFNLEVSEAAAEAQHTVGDSFAYITANVK
jgi:acyl carrier protein